MVSISLQVGRLHPYQLPNKSPLRITGHGSVQGTGLHKAKASKNHLCSHLTLPSTGRDWAVNLGIGLILLSEFIIYMSVQKTRLLDHSLGHSLGTCWKAGTWGPQSIAHCESMEVHSLLRVRLCNEICKGLLSLLPSLPPMESELD